MKRIPELDGVRGIAVLMVIVLHVVFSAIDTPIGSLSAYAIKPFLALGRSGVDLFFVLSGFLIGGILLDNKDAQNYFSVFYTRRACRIFPIYYLLVLALPLVLLIPQLSNLVSGRIPYWSYFFYSQNFFMAALSIYGSCWLGPTWSLAIEEQFYLVAPLIVRKLSVKNLAAAAIAAIMASVALRFALHFTPQYFLAPYVLTFARLDGLASGVLCAIIVRHGITQRRSLGFLLILIPIAAVVSSARQAGPFASLGYLFFSIGYSALILKAVTQPESLVSKIARARFLRHVGQFAYALYLFHLSMNIIFHWLAFRHDPSIESVAGIAVTAASLLLTYALARLSWWLIESPMIRLGQRAQYRKASQLPLQAAFPRSQQFELPQAPPASELPTGSILQSDTVQ